MVIKVMFISTKFNSMLANLKSKTKTMKSMNGHSIPHNFKLVISNTAKITHQLTHSLLKSMVVSKSK